MCAFQEMPSWFDLPTINEWNQAGFRGQIEMGADDIVQNVDKFYLKTDSRTGQKEEPSERELAGGRASSLRRSSLNGSPKRESSFAEERSQSLPGSPERPSERLEFRVDNGHMAREICKTENRNVGIDFSNTVFGGFSQGASMALFAGMRGLIRDQARGRKMEKERGSDARMTSRSPKRSRAEAVDDDADETPPSPKRSKVEDGRSPSGYVARTSSPGAAGSSGRIRECPKGILALSTYIPGAKALLDAAKSVGLGSSSGGDVVPVLICHGTTDRVLEHELADETKSFLEETCGKRVDVKLQKFPGLEHKFCPVEEAVVIEWLKKVFPPPGGSPRRSVSPSGVRSSSPGNPGRASKK